MTAPATTSITHPGGYAANPTIITGAGRPVVYLHGCFGIEWGGFLEQLADGYKLYAPVHAGSRDFTDLETLDSLWELVLYYDDLFRALGLDEFDLVGHSFGGMVAAEIAATRINRLRKLVLMAPMGLWDDAAPVADHMLAMPPVQARLRFHDLDNPEVTRVLTPPTDPEAHATAMVQTYMALGASGHFIHPIPERGLHRRLRRIEVPTLILWGDKDTLVPPSYADGFRNGIANSSVQIIADAGHTLHVEQPAAVARAVRAFLG